MSRRRDPAPSRLVALARASYPSWWKARYGDEVGVLCTDLLAEGRRPSRLAGGLFAGALDARLRGTGLPPVASVHRGRARAALVAATLPVLVTFPLVVWIAFSTDQRSAWTSGAGYWLPAAHGVRQFVRTGGPPSLSAGGYLATYSQLALMLLLMFTFLVLFALWSEVRARLVGGGLAWAALWWAPVLFAAAAVVLSTTGNYVRPQLAAGRRGTLVDGRIVTVSTYAPGGHPLLAGALGVGAWVAVALLLASTVAVAVAVARRELPPETLQVGVGIGRLLSVATALTALAVTGWAVGLALEPRPDLHLSYSTVTSPLAPWSGVLAGVLLLVAAGTVTGARQARRCWRTAGWLAFAER